MNAQLHAACARGDLDAVAELVALLGCSADIALDGIPEEPTALQRAFSAGSADVLVGS